MRKKKTRDRWTGWIDGPLWDDMTRHSLGRSLFRELWTIVDENPDTRSPDTFVRWIYSNYASAACLFVRRQAEHRTDSVSLGRLLAGMRSTPQVVTREWFVGQYDERKRVMGEHDFDGLFGPGSEQMSTEAVEEQLETLAKVADSISIYTSKAIAHMDPNRPEMVPTWDSLDDALEAVERIYTWCFLVVKQGAVSLPWTEPGWQDVLRAPWLKGSDLG